MTDETCRYCGHPLAQSEDDQTTWLATDATGDDSIWQETCPDNHTSRVAPHEPQAPRYEHYFVVAATEDTEGVVTFTLDGATAMARFDDRPIWDSWTGDWVERGDDEAEDAARDTRMDRLLNAIIDVDDDGIPTTWTEDDARKFVSLVVKRYGLAADYNDAVAKAAAAKVSGWHMTANTHLWDAVREANSALGLVSE
jgi:hypothetical protein